MSVGHEEARLVQVQVQVQIMRPIAGTHAIRSHHHAHHIGEHSEPAEGDEPKVPKKTGKT